MNTSMATISPQTAPRSPEELAKVGIFQLRLLVEKLGGNSTPEEKQAFALMTLELKVAHTMQLLAKWDKEHGGPGQAPPPPYMNGSASNGVPTNGAAGYAMPPAMNAIAPSMAPMSGNPVMQQQPLPMPNMGQQNQVQQPFPSAPAFSGFPQGQAQQMGQGLAPQISQVDPGAVAAAQAATAPATATGRKPRTKATDVTPDSSELVAQILTALTTIGGLVQGLTNEVAAIKTVVSGLAEQSPKDANNIKQIFELYNGLHGWATQLDGRINEIRQVSGFTLTSSVLHMENAFGLARREILGEVATASNDVAAFIQGK